jgi:selenocysteine lyase/cysteine desulfurase
MPLAVTVLPGADRIASAPPRNALAHDLRGRLKGSRGWGARTVDEYLVRLDLLTGGAVRVSLGIASNVADVERFLGFLRTTYRDRPAGTEGLKPRLRC